MKYFVIAENYNQALTWTQLNKKRIYEQQGLQPGRMKYVQSVETLRGIREPKGIFIGTWYKRPDIESIITQLQIADSILPRKAQELMNIVDRKRTNFF